jgi:hypothetical protein
MVYPWCAPLHASIASIASIATTRPQRTLSHALRLLQGDFPLVQISGRDTPFEFHQRGAVRQARRHYL